MPRKAQKSKLSGGLPWPDLIPGFLIKRYKRFLADVKLAGGEVVTAHCANSGTMKECSQPGMPVYLSYHDNPKRKFKYTWEIIEMPGSLVGVNTNVPNRLVAGSIQEKRINELKNYDDVRREVKTSDHTRLDILLSGRGKRNCYVEVKNCTLVKTNTAYFPDAVTTRGLKHLIELQKLVSAGHRGVIFYLIQRMDAALFKPADHIDPAYGEGLRKAVKNGVEILVYDVVLDLDRIVIGKKIPHSL